MQRREFITLLDAGGTGRRVTPHGPFRRFLRGLIHFFSYHLILARQSTRVTRAAGFRLTVRPTVFHPRYFISSECFADFIGGLDLSSKHVVDVGTGSGILALAAARAGADTVSNRHQSKRRPHRRRERARQRHGRPRHRRVH